MNLADYYRLIRSTLCAHTRSILLKLHRRVFEHGDSSAKTKGYIYCQSGHALPNIYNLVCKKDFCLSRDPLQQRFLAGMSATPHPSSRMWGLPKTVQEEVVYPLKRVTDMELYPHNSKLQSLELWVEVASSIVVQKLALALVMRGSVSGKGMGLVCCVTTITDIATVSVLAKCQDEPLLTASPNGNPARP